MPWQDPIVARLAADEAESCCLPNPPLLSLLVFVWAIGHGWRLHEVRPRDARGRGSRGGVAVLATTPTRAPDKKRPKIDNRI